MITSDGSVIERAADLGITYFDTARGYQSGNNERMVGAALKSKRKDIMLSSKTHAGTRRPRRSRDLDTSLKELGTDYLDIWYLHAKSKPRRGHRRPDRGAADRQEGRQDPLRRRQHPRRAARADSASWPKTPNIDVILHAPTTSPWSRS